MVERTQRVGRFEIVSELARGAMGKVYRARDPQLGRDVALKTIQAKGNERYLPLLRKRFKREGKALAIFPEDSGVPWIIRITGPSPASR